MKKIIPILLVLAIFFACNKVQKEQPKENEKKVKEIEYLIKENLEFSEFFKNKTMRVDYFHR